MVRSIEDEMFDTSLVMDYSTHGGLNAGSDP